MSSTKSAKDYFSCCFCCAESLDLSINKRKRVSAAFSVVCEHRSSTKQAKEGAGGFFSRVEVLPLNKQGVGGVFCRMESVDLALNKQRRTSVAFSTVWEAYKSSTK